jgi:hypothetical protein
MRVHLICQPQLFLGSPASACIHTINCHLPKNFVRKSGIRAGVRVGGRCRGIDRCVGGPTVYGLISRDAVAESEFVAQPPYGKKQSSWNSACRCGAPMPRGGWTGKVISCWQLRGRHQCSGRVVGLGPFLMTSLGIEVAFFRAGEFCTRDKLQLP